MAHWVVSCVTEAEPTAKYATLCMATTINGREITTEAEAIAAVQEHRGDAIAAKLDGRVIAEWRAYLQEA